MRTCGDAGGSLYIPNPATGHFDTFGQFTQPWQFNMGLQMHYDVSPRVSANLTVANLVNECFGGSVTQWSQQFAPSNTICGYSPNLFYISNFYNGSGPNDVSRQRRAAQSVLSKRVYAVVRRQQLV